jgi:hypothetical protein
LSFEARHIEQERCRRNYFFKNMHKKLLFFIEFLENTQAGGIFNHGRFSLRHLRCQFFGHETGSNSAV